jgi:steroid 5-alpha reductase family enzyme
MAAVGDRTRAGRSGWIDAIWSLAVALVGGRGAGSARRRHAPRQGLVAAWSRFGGCGWGHIALRTAGHGDDPRYAQLRREWGALSARLFLSCRFRLWRAWLLVLCVMLAPIARRPFPRGATSPGLVLMPPWRAKGWPMAVARFSQGSRQQGPHLRHRPVGPSRHPNYFFEWLAGLPMH